MAIPLQPPLVDAVDSSSAGTTPGNKEAQRVVLERLSGRIRRITRLFLRDGADADDAAQVALLKILVYPNLREPSDTLEDWAERVAVGVALQHAKRERRRKNLLLRWLMPGRLPWGQETRSQPYEDPSLEDALGRLSAAQREAFVLRHMLEYTVAEISELTETPAGTIKNRLLAARKALRAEFRATSRKFGGQSP
jgi:RNA polymerase sigma-70 factor, ECF subfamily